MHKMTDLTGWMLETNYYIKRLLGNLYFTQLRTVDILTPVQKLDDRVRIEKMFGSISIVNGPVAIGWSGGMSSL